MRKLGLILGAILIFFTSFSYIESEFKVIESKNVLNEQELLLDINSASRSEMLEVGISKGYVDKLIEYREITGGFLKLRDMVRISGIGDKTYERLKVHFKEPYNVKYKSFNINQVDDKTLIYYGFSKKEIKDIREAQSKNGIRNNLDLKKIIPKNKYEKLKNYIRY